MTYTVLYVHRKYGTCYEKEINRSTLKMMQENPFVQVLHYVETKEEVK